MNCRKIGKVTRSYVKDRLMKVLRYVNVIVKIYQTIKQIKLASSKSNFRPFSGINKTFEALNISYHQSELLCNVN